MTDSDEIRSLREIRRLAEQLSGSPKGLIRDYAETVLAETHSLVRLVAKRPEDL